MTIEYDAIIRAEILWWLTCRGTSTKEQIRRGIEYKHGITVGRIEMNDALGALVESGEILETQRNWCYYYEKNGGKHGIQKEGRQKASDPDQA